MKDDDQPREPIFAQGGRLILLKFALGVALALVIGWFMRAIIPPIF